MDILIDYFRVSFKELEIADLVEYLGLQNLDFLEGKARDGWTRHDFYNGIHLYSVGRDDIGLEMSGVGCRTLETVNNCSFDWLTFFRWVVDFGDAANVSRLDVAGDDKDGILDFSVLVRHTRAGKYISKARKRIWIEGDEREIMFGASSSSTRLRIYDKALERGVDYHWIRAEFQLRDEAADSFISNLLSLGDIGSTYGGVLLNYLRYTTKAPDPSKSHNYDALNTTVWWEKFVATSGKIRNVTVGGLEYNLQSLEDFISKQCASSIRAYLAVFSADRLFSVVGSTNYSDKQTQLVSSFGLVSEKERFCSNCSYYDLCPVDYQADVGFCCDKWELSHE